MYIIFFHSQNRVKLLISMIFIAFADCKILKTYTKYEYYEYLVLISLKECTVRINQ